MFLISSQCCCDLRLVGTNNLLVKMLCLIEINSHQSMRELFGGGGAYSRSNFFHDYLIPLV